MTDETQTPDPKVLEINKAMNELKAANDAYEAEKVRAEKLRAEQMRAGRSELAEPIKQETAEEAYARRAKERYKGTGMDPTR